MTDYATWYFGTVGDIPIVDVNNIGVFRPSNGHWFFGDGKTNGSEQQHSEWWWGKSGDLPFMSGNRIGVFRDGVWLYGTIGSDQYAREPWHFGMVGDIPFVDGSRIGVFRPGNGWWYFGDGTTDADAAHEYNTWSWGMDGDIPFICDDIIGVFRPSNGNWYFGTIGSDQYARAPWNFGKVGDYPFVFKRNGKTHMGVFRGSTHEWIYGDGVTHGLRLPNPFADAGGIIIAPPPGGGSTTYTCNHCGYVWTLPMPVTGARCPSCNLLPHDTPPPFAASFTANPLTGHAPLTVQFTDTSTGFGITSWSWTINGRVVSNEPSFVHTFPYTGSYEVKLTIGK